MVNMAISAVVLLAVNMLERRDLLSEAGRKKEGRPMSLCVDIEKKLGAFRLRAQFEAQDGTTALLGASGCGKSVTSKCIAGIMTPDCGRIVLGDRVLFDSEKKIDLPPQQRRVGYLFQQYALFPNMTVEQNILCGIRREHKAQKKGTAGGEDPHVPSGGA